MLTATKPVLDVPESDSEYPPELIEQWARSVEITKIKRATGELKPKSVREFAAERGISID